MSRGQYNKPRCPCGKARVKRECPKCRRATTSKNKKEGLPAWRQKVLSHFKDGPDMMVQGVFMAAMAVMYSCVPEDEADMSETKKLRLFGTFTDHSEVPEFCGNSDEEMIPLLTILAFHLAVAMTLIDPFAGTSLITNSIKAEWSKVKCVTADLNVLRTPSLTFKGMNSLNPAGNKKLLKRRPANFVFSPPFAVRAVAMPYFYAYCDQFVAMLLPIGSCLSSPPTYFDAFWSKLEAEGLGFIVRTRCSRKKVGALAWFIAFKTKNDVSLMFSTDTADFMTYKNSPASRASRMEALRNMKKQN